MILNIEDMNREISLAVEELRGDGKLHELEQKQVLFIQFWHLFYILNRQFVL